MIRGLKSLPAVLTRRVLLSFLGLSSLAVLVGRSKNSRQETNMIEKQFALDFQWQTQEPFLFCVHHYDFYPKGNGQFGPDKSLLAGRDLGQDFDSKDGFRMYHGDAVPGFPVHPHRGFETITIVRKGFVDHADSLGAAGRYGHGDVQWMTAGAGVQHSEMFPLLKSDADNTLELFQIWLNLPQKSKMVPAHFTMFWSEKIPVVNLGKVRLTIIAGDYQKTKALPPPPDSWASQKDSDTAVWLIKLQPGGEFEIPNSSAQAARTLYLFEGKGATLNGQAITTKTGLNVDSSQKMTISAGESETEVLMLQSKAIGEPVVQYGPFVMNSEADIRKTIVDYQRTQFGGWPWKRPDMVHGNELMRFAQFPDGRVERPQG